ncbi:MAG: HTH-type transcriptional regulator / antitoxin HigA [Blastocatellia bacterium]|jgi:HTH-type transcriptional regulator/antitoxin HigA|nr:HTH-type transcriptional regulator / antitoxin HigA [Blastocatellia bacterium]
MPVAIQTEEENARMLAEVEKLMAKGENLSPEEDALLRLMATLIQDFETKFYQPEDATPLEILLHLMEARDLKQSDLLEVFGSKGVASEVINGKRGISKAQAKALAKFFGVASDLFI